MGDSKLPDGLKLFRENMLMWWSWWSRLCFWLMFWNSQSFFDSWIIAWVSSAFFEPLFSRCELAFWKKTGCWLVVFLGAASYWKSLLGGTYELTTKLDCVKLLRTGLM